MNPRLQTLLAALALGALTCSSAQAAFITGSMTVANGIDPGSLPTPPSGSVVSLLPGIEHAAFPGGVASGCTSDFDTANSCAETPVLTDWVWAAPGALLAIDGFTFTISHVDSIVPNLLECDSSPVGGVTCDDALVVRFTGIVTGNGFDPTTFTGRLALTGSCIGSVENQLAPCLTDYSAGYTYSLSATGRGQVPEPGSLALLGAAIAGLGLIRRRRS